MKSHNFLAVFVWRIRFLEWVADEISNFKSEFIPVSYKWHINKIFIIGKRLIKSLDIYCPSKSIWKDEDSTLKINVHIPFVPRYTNLVRIQLRIILPTWKTMFTSCPNNSTWCSNEERLHAVSNRRRKLRNKAAFVREQNCWRPLMYSSSHPQRSISKTDESLQFISTMLCTFAPCKSLLKSCSYFFREFC